MSELQLIVYYANLLILQYRGKPKAYAMIQALAKLAIVNKLPLTVRDAFNPATAVGVQLDVVGKYVGVKRYVYDFTGPVTLSDDDFRQLIKIKIVLNSSDSSLKTIRGLLSTYFPGVIKVIDYYDMTMSYVFDAEFGSEQLAEVFVKEGLLPRPLGVRLRTPIYSPTSDNFFGYRSYQAQNTNSSPYNTYENYETDRPFLTYEDGIGI